MKEEILNFINRRFKEDSHWLNGNCLWFAIILNKRFNLPIWYFPITGHFVIKYNEEYYDWTGIVISDNEKPVSLDWIKENDIKWYNALIRDCYM